MVVTLESFGLRSLMVGVSKDPVEEGKCSLS